jgi:hypothetical protein
VGSSGYDARTNFYENPSLGSDIMKRITVNTVPAARAFLIICRRTLQ